MKPQAISNAVKPLISVCRRGGLRKFEADKRSASVSNENARGVNPPGLFDRGMRERSERPGTIPT